MPLFTKKSCGKIQVQNSIVVFLDSDDVTHCFSSYFNAILRTKGYDIPKDYIPKKYSYAELMSKSEFDKYFNALPQNWPYLLKTYRGAAEFTRRLHEIGCRIVILTSIDNYSLPDRMRRLNEDGIYYNECYATKGRRKSEFVKYLLPRYQNFSGGPVSCILVDDHAANAAEFLKNVPSSDAAVTMNVPYGREWLKEPDARLICSARTAQELYASTIEVIMEIIKKKAIDF